MIWTFYARVVKVEKGWMKQEFVLLVIAALPSEIELPNEYISYWTTLWLCHMPLLLAYPQVMSFLPS